MRIVHSFREPERFVAGTVGQPGDRTFYLQAKQGPKIVSVALEKGQVQALAERIGQLLAEARRQGASVAPELGLDDVAPLLGPVEEEFRVGSMALAWDGDADEVVVEAMAVPDRDTGGSPEPLSDDVEGPDTLRVHLSPAMARSFARRAERVVAAGRPPCFLCGRPLDVEGHLCPRLN